MAKTTTKSTGTKRKPRSKPVAARAKTPARAVARRRASASGKESSAVDALLKLLESPLVADLLAVGATAAFAALTEHRSSRKSGGDASKTILRAVATAAAAAIGRRLTTEFEEIRNAANVRKTKGGGSA